MKRQTAGVISAVLREHGQGTPTRLEEGREREGLCRSCWERGILGEKGILVGGVWGMGVVQRQENILL